MWWTWPSLAFLPRHRAVPRSSGRSASAAVSLDFGVKMITMMVIRLCHATLHLLLSSNEAWDSRGSMGMGALHTSHNPLARIRPSASYQSHQLEGAAA